MSRMFPDRLVIRRAAEQQNSGGWQDDDGVWHPDPGDTAITPPIVAEGAADIQDRSERYVLSVEGEPSAQHDAVAFLKSPAILQRIHAGDQAEIIYRDRSRATATVVGIRRIDWTVLLRRIAVVTQEGVGRFVMRPALAIAGTSQNYLRLDDPIPWTLDSGVHLDDVHP